MTGYSGTPLAKKLGIKAGHRVALVGAPRGFEALLVGLEACVKVSRGLRGSLPFDVMVAFFARGSHLDRDVPGLRARLAPAGGLWIAWPKQSSGVVTDVGERRARARGLALGLVDNKVCAIDDTWSALRFVVRLRDRP